MVFWPRSAASPVVADAGCAGLDVQYPCGLGERQLVDGDELDDVTQRLWQRVESADQGRHATCEVEPHSVEVLTIEAFEPVSVVPQRWRPAKALTLRVPHHHTYASPMWPKTLQGVVSEDSLGCQHWRSQALRHPKRDRARWPRQASIFSIFGSRPSTGMAGGAAKTPTTDASGGFSPRLGVPLLPLLRRQVEAVGDQNRRLRSWGGVGIDLKIDGGLLEPVSVVTQPA